MKRPRWLMPLLRYGLCVAAIVFLATRVTLHDRVRLGEAHGPLVRLVEERPEGVVIERDGRREVLPWSAVYHVAVEGTRLPDIEHGILGVVRQLDVGLALVSVAIFAPVWFIQAYRLVLMVAVQGVRLSYWNAVKLTFAGNFFNFALPGTTGGDLVKAYYITHYTHLKTEVVTTVFLDRAIGLLGLVFIAIVGIVVTWNPRAYGALTLVLLLLLAGLGLGTVIVFSRRIRHALRLPDLAAQLPGGQHLLRIGRATIALRAHPAKVALAMLSTLVLQSIAILSAAVMAWAVHMRSGGGWFDDLAYFFIYVSVGFLIAAIPITPPQAIGVMEAAYVKFFATGGLNTASQAVALALAVRLIQLVWAVPGVLVPLLGAHLPSKDELARLEGHTPAAPETEPARAPSTLAR